MSPFGLMLRDLRLRHGLRQADLAHSMGYEQTYWSALELGTKGPPPRTFVEKLANTLGLDDETADTLMQALDDSCRHMTLPVGSPTELFHVFSEFRRQAETLHPVQLALIKDALSLRHELKDRHCNFDESPRIRRRHLPSGRKAGDMT